MFLFQPPASLMATSLPSFTALKNKDEKKSYLTAGRNHCTEATPNAQDLRGPPDDVQAYRSRPMCS